MPDKKKRIRKRIIVTLWIGFLFAILSGCGIKNEPDTLEEVQKSQSSESVKTSEESDQEADQMSDTKSAEKIESTEVVYVFVCGQVASPGVYELAEGSRICQAIDAAGGMLDTAAADWVNQAEIAEDGQKIYVPTKEEAETMPDGQQTAQMQDASWAEGADGKVHLNTATKEELMTLTGIGDKKAEAIIRYRESNGGFQSVEELTQVEGIKEGTYNKIKDSIVI